MHLVECLHNSVISDKTHSTSSQATHKFASTSRNRSPPFAEVEVAQNTNGLDPLARPQHSTLSLVDRKLANCACAGRSSREAAGVVAGWGGAKRRRLEAGREVRHLRAARMKGSPRFARNCLRSSFGGGRGNIKIAVEYGSVKAARGEAANRKMSIGIRFCLYATRICRSE